MPKLSFQVTVSKNLIPKVTKDTRTTVRKAVRTIAQDLARTASEAAPHKTGDLEDSYSIGYQNGTDKITATVEFAVYKGNFNYAIAMHEWTYNLGEGSLRKSGGTGMSGNHYAVGRKFLTRVLEGESQTYANYILTQVASQLLRS